MDDSKKTKAQLVEELEKLREHSECLKRDRDDHEEARETLGNNRKTLEKLIEHFPFCISIYDAEGYFVKGNRLFYKQFPAPGTGLSIFEDPRIIKGPWSEDFQELKKGEVITTREVWLNPADVNLERQDKVMCLDASGFSIKNSKGEIEFFVIVHKDITDQKLAEEALRESEERYRAIVETQTELVDRFLHGGIITFANDALCRFMNRTREELIGTSFLHFIPEEERVKFDTLFESITLEDPTFNHEHRVLMPDGEVRWLQWSNRGLFDGNGKLIECQAVGRDVTEIKVAEQALRESENKYRDLVENISDIIYTVDRDGCLTYISPVVESIFGYHPSEIIGKPIVEGLFEEDKPAGIETIKEGYKGKSGTMEFRGVTKTGELRWVLSTSRPIVEDGEIKGLLGILRDITDQKLAEEKLLQTSRLEAAATLAAGVAHDFNNLMVGVLGNAELLKLECQDKPDTLDKLMDIAGAAQEAGELAQQMLAFARGGKYQPKIINLNDIITSGLRLHKRTFPPRISILRNLDEELMNINADPTQMDQVVTNLCINAVEAIEGRGTITITTGNIDIEEDSISAYPGLNPGPHIFLIIEDSGSGMDEETLNKVFDPFFTTKFTGRGLGLAATYGIIKNHGGYISVSSEVGSGTTFRIYLPATEAEQEKQPVDEMGIPRGTETILIIDDEEIVVDVTRDILKRLGYNILCCVNGKEAIEIAKDHDGEIHLALLDMGMPVMDGTEAFPLLRKARPDMKVIICSGYELDEASRALIDAGANGFIQKPFTMELLGQTIRESLDS